MTKNGYSGYRFHPEIIHRAIWLYVRFTLSFRDVEDSLGSAELQFRAKQSDVGQIIAVDRASAVPDRANAHEQNLIQLLRDALPGAACFLESAGHCHIWQEEALSPRPAGLLSH